VEIAKLLLGYDPKLYEFSAETAQKHTSKQFQKQNQRQTQKEVSITETDSETDSEPVSKQNQNQNQKTESVIIFRTIKSEKANSSA
jgi:hypothetical protein